MVSIANVKTKITSIIRQYGNQVYVITQATPVKDAYGQISYSETEASYIAVSDQYVINQMRLGSSGRFTDGQIVMFFEGDAVIAKDNIVRKGTERYKVIDVEKYEAQDIVIAYRVLLGVE